MAKSDKPLTDAQLKKLVADDVKKNAAKDWDKASQAEKNAADEMTGYWANGDKK
jgi:hypothetical protein